MAATITCEVPAPLDSYKILRTLNITEGRLNNESYLCYAIEKLPVRSLTLVETKLPTAS